MQQELDSQRPDLEIDLLGVNEYGHGGDSITSLVDLPWIKDDYVVTSSASSTGAMQTVKEAWGANYRDVVIVGPQNELVTAFNLTTHNLNIQSNYDALKTLLIDVAEGNYP